MIHNIQVVTNTIYAWLEAITIIDIMISATFATYFHILSAQSLAKCPNF